MEAKIMPTIKNIGQKPTMLNGYVVQEGHTANVSEKQANSLISDHSDQWALVGGAVKAVASEQLRVSSEKSEPEPKKIRRQKGKKR